MEDIMMTQKLLSLTLAAALGLSLTACGGGSDGGDTAASTAPSGSAVPTESSAPAESAPASETPTNAESGGSDLEYIQKKGTLVVGITEFQPMDYMDSNGEWIGFDADMAKAFAESLGVEAEFQLIQWGAKVLELDGRNIDVAWNGMTLTKEVTSAMSCSNPYFDNAQVVIVPKDKAADYQTVESLKDASFAVESGSAAQEQAKINGFTYTEVLDQATALLEVSTGTSDAAIIDYLMATVMTGEGTSYENLTTTVSLNSEQYGVGFRKGSDLTEKLNEFFKTSYEDGTMQKIAETYHITDKLIDQTNVQGAA